MIRLTLNLLMNSTHQKLVTIGQFSILQLIRWRLQWMLRFNYVSTTVITWIMTHSSLIVTTTLILTLELTKSLRTILWSFTTTLIIGTMLKKERQKSTMYVSISTTTIWFMKTQWYITLRWNTLIEKITSTRNSLENLHNMGHSTLR